MKTTDDDGGNGKLWCLAGKDSILEARIQATQRFLLLIPNRALSHLTPV